MLNVQSVRKKIMLFKNSVNISKKQRNRGDLAMQLLLTQEVEEIQWMFRALL